MSRNTYTALADQDGDIVPPPGLLVITVRTNNPSRPSLAA